MRYDAEHKQRTKERLLKETAKAIRREGPHKVGVAAIMAKAGLTHGGFYAHFASRDEMIAEGVTEMFRQGRERLARSLSDRPPAEALKDYIDFYLSPAHRDTRTTGCPLPFLSADAPRLPEPVRARFAEGVQALEASLAEPLRALGRPDAAAEAGSLLAEMVGAVALSRAEPDKARSDDMLRRSRERILQRLGLETPR
jgi:TetR/AcrR family transcriptional repressor of nem operon